MCDVNEGSEKRFMGMTSELWDKIKKIIDRVVGDYRFELNDEITRSRIKRDVEMAIEDKCDFDLKLNKIRSLKVVCDSTNNSYIEIDKGQLSVNVHLQGNEKCQVK